MSSILIADDDPPGRKLLATLLGYAGYTTLHACDGAEALALTRQEHPDLVIADLLMPVMDGFEFVRQVRADVAVADTKVVFCTATYDEREARRLAEQCGVLHILAKPTNPEQLLLTVRMALNERLPDVAATLPIDFDQAHLRLVSDRLVRSAHDLEALNARLAALVTLGLQLASEEDPQALINAACRGARQLIAASTAVVELEGDKARADDATRQAPSSTQLSAPLASPSSTYGRIGVGDKLDGRTFTADDELLLSLLAAQLAVAYENTQRARSLAAAIRARDEFLVTAAHELKTPLTSLLSSAQVLLMRIGQPLDSEMSTRRLKAIDEQTRRMGNLVSRLLDISRLQLGRFALDPQLVDLSQLVAATVAAYPDNGLGNLLSVSADVPTFVNADPLRIEQVLINLLDNAFKFSPGGETIEIETMHIESDAVRLIVRDHGIGIPVDKRARIFDRFYQAHSADHRSGLGLGLHICHEIIALHGGHIRAEFPPDGGTRFVIDLAGAHPEAQTLAAA